MICYIQFFTFFLNCVVVTLNAYFNYGCRNFISGARYGETIIPFNINK